MPSESLIHAAIWPQQIWAENCGAVPLWKRGAVSPANNVVRAEAYLHAKFHLDPFNRLATVHERHRQTGQTDSLRRTVLQTIAQK